MTTNDQDVTEKGPREGLESGATSKRQDYALQLQEALHSAGLASSNSRDVFLLDLVGAALGILAKSKVNEALEPHDGTTPLSPEQKIALLICEAVYLFVRSCFEVSSEDPIARGIWNKTRGEDLAKLVIDDGLDYIFHPHTFGILHFKSAYQYFHSKLKKALQKAKVDPPEDFEAATRKCLASAKQDQ
ncbi:hypothetical protein L218DRAFT_1008192 [Marasmius fiardii PR-910]|nr:hypothetical protein L218DRAFT_1008192 [Marasmius fiardii PR-910]